MNYFELTITVLLNRNIYFADSGYVIGKNINKIMLLDESLKEFHPKKEYKNYVFNSFFPLEKDKTYKKDNLYIFKIRSLDYEFCEKMYKLSPYLKSDDFKVISADIKEINKKTLKEIYTITPLIITIDNKPWMQNDDLNLFKERLEINLEKKYKNFYNEDISAKDKLINNITFKNRVPMYYNYKNIRLLGNKISISIHDNEDAQKLAFLALAVGLGEKNSSVGAGFCQGT
ncbi:CRISPR-associated endoribonuclease Cas6 [Clostridium amazonitimonense]|uniref:CRISPR-associated endoribonuclease Cas6 n=1 Tax=Clostridium amazonitimonense TaxID=1499689 RepID=UPI000509A6F3|nr:CRISPR-associated endoribonuclease Cas6 [Clostridium amazonitimonense]